MNKFIEVVPTWTKEADEDGFLAVTDVTIKLNIGSYNSLISLLELYVDKEGTFLTYCATSILLEELRIPTYKRVETE